MTRAAITRAKYRTRLLTVVLTHEVNKTIIQAVSAMMLATVSINHKEEQPPLEELRTILEPAYVEVAAILNREFGDRLYTSAELDNLHAEFNVVLGNYRLRVSWQSEGAHQGFILDVKTVDQKSILSRYVEEYGYQADRVLL